MKQSEKTLTKFADRYVSTIKRSVKDQLYLESPIRNKFQIYPLDEGEIPVFKNKKIAYLIRETGDIDEDCGIDKIKAIKANEVVPFLFEINCYIEAPFSILIKMDNKDILKLFLGKVKILEKEKKLFSILKKYLKNGKGIFVIRTDIQVLICNDLKKQTIGYSMFEQVGAVVISK